MAKKGKATVVVEGSEMARQEEQPSFHGSREGRRRGRTPGGRRRR